MSDSPGVTVFKDKLYCFYQGSGEDGQILFTSSPDGSNWAAGAGADVGMSAGPAVVVYNDLLYCFYQSSGDSGQLMYITNDGSNWQPHDQRIPTNVGMSAGPSACYG